ncbi:hypothetical protein STEG23_022115, partial [Scotinomys teguina]
GDKDLNSPRELTPEAEKELALVEKKVQDGHVDRVDPKLDCILVILPSRHSPTGILMQREDIILKWIFLPNKQSKKLKTYVEKISDLILKGKLRLRQLAGIDPAEIVVPLTKEEIEKLWAESEPWQRACSNFLGEINSKYPKSDRIELIKRADWILPRIVRETPISGVRTFYTDANKQGKAGYKSEDLSKVVQSPYNSVQKSELYAILLVLMDFSEPLNIVTDSQYAERVVLHIETAEFIPDESELTSLFIQLQDIIRNRKHPLYITHIRSHTGLPGPLAQVTQMDFMKRNFYLQSKFLDIQHTLLEADVHMQTPGMDMTSTSTRHAHGPQTYIQTKSSSLFSPPISSNTFFLAQILFSSFPFRKVQASQGYQSNMVYEAIIILGTFPFIRLDKATKYEDMLMLYYLFYEAQDGTVHSELGSLIIISNQQNGSSICASLQIKDTDLAMARKAGQGKEEEESRARQQEEKMPVRDEEKKPVCHGGTHHVVFRGDIVNPMQRTSSHIISYLAASCLQL